MAKLRGRRPFVSQATRRLGPDVETLEQGQDAVAFHSGAGLEASVGDRLLDPDVEHLDEQHPIVVERQLARRGIGGRDCGGTEQGQGSDNG